MVYRIATDSLRKALLAGHRQPLLDLWSVVLGEIPPVNSARTKWDRVQFDLRSIASAHACFRGIKRPFGDDDNGFDVYAFVSQPVTTFKYVPAVSCVIEPVAIPHSVVCVAYVRMDYPFGRSSQTEARLARGVMTHWEFVEADEEKLPIEWNVRYRKREW